MILCSSLFAFPLDGRRTASLSHHAFRLRDNIISLRVRAHYRRAKWIQRRTRKKEWSGEKDEQKGRLKCMLKVSDTSQQSFKIMSVWLPFHSKHARTHSATRKTVRFNIILVLLHPWRHVTIFRCIFSLFYFSFSFCLAPLVFNFRYSMPLSSLGVDVPFKGESERWTMKRTRNVSVSECVNRHNNHLRIYEEIDVCRSSWPHSTIGCTSECDGFWLNCCSIASKICRVVTSHHFRSVCTIA